MNIPKPITFLLAIALIFVAMITPVYASSTQPNYVSSPCPNFSNQTEVLIDKIYRPLPTINVFQRFCVAESSLKRTNIEDCLDSVPETKASKRNRFENERDFEVLREIVFDLDQDNVALEPYEEFCLITQDAKDLDECLTLGGY